MSEQKENKLVSYVKSSIEELKKVKWLTVKEAVNHTILVIIVSIFMALFLGFLDYGLTQILYKILKIQ